MTYIGIALPVYIYNVNIKWSCKHSKPYVNQKNSKLQETVNMYMHMTNIIKCYMVSYRMKNVHIMEVQYKRYQPNI